MKKLLLIRHASAEDTFMKPDIERVLSVEGLREIELISSKFSLIEFTPELIITSSAKRTLQTIDIVAQRLNWDKNLISVSEDIYNSDYKSILSEIYKTSNDVNSLVIVAHNPAISDVYNLFNNTEFLQLSTCSFCFFEFKTDKWEQISYTNIQRLIKTDKYS